MAGQVAVPLGEGRPLAGAAATQTPSELASGDRVLGGVAAGVDVREQGSDIALVD